MYPVFPNAQDLEKTIAQDQPQYIPLPSFRTEICTISRWSLSDSERAHLAAGGDLFISQVNGNAPLQPILPIANTPDSALSIALDAEAALLRKL